MNITLGFADLIRLFGVNDPSNFAPGLELRDEGVFVAPRDNLPAIARGGEEEAVLTEHPTGNLAEPVLVFPCSLDALETFMEQYGLLYAAVNPFRLLKHVEQKAWEMARADEKNLERHHWPVMAGLYGLREKYQREYEHETNDAKKVVLREMLDDLNTLLPEGGRPPSFDGWPWGEYENTNLRKFLVPAVAEFWEPASPKQPSGAPSNPQVAEWLQKECGATAAIAEKIASIIRADWAPGGRRRKTA